MRSMYGRIPSFLRGDAVERPSEALRRERTRSERALKGAWRGRPHTDEAVFAVRQLVEGTTLTYGAISDRTGVGRASICRWTQDGKWVRPAGAPVATDMACSHRASAALRARTLHRRAQAIAERILDDLERDPSVGRDELWAALEMLKAARLARMPKTRRRAGEPGAVAAATTVPPVREQPRREPARRREEKLPSPHLPEVLEQHRRLKRDLRRTSRREQAHLAMLRPDPRGT